MHAKVYNRLILMQEVVHCLCLPAAPLQAKCLPCHICGANFVVGVTNGALSMVAESLTRTRRWF